MPTRRDKPDDGCKATKEDLMNQKDPLNSTDDCPICREDYDVLCRVANHPSRPLLPSTGFPQAPIEEFRKVVVGEVRKVVVDEVQKAKVEIMEKVDANTFQNTDASLMSPTAYAIDREGIRPLLQTVQSQLDGHPIVPFEELHAIQEIAKSENQFVALITPYLQQVIKYPLTLVNSEEYKWMRQLDRKGTRNIDLKPDMFVCPRGIYVNKIEPNCSAFAGNMGEFRSRHLAKEKKNFVFGTMPWGAKQFLRLIMEFVNENISPGDYVNFNQEKRGKVYQYLSHLIRNDDESNYVAALCGRDGFYATTWKGALQPVLGDFVPYNALGSSEYLNNLLDRNADNIWNILLNGASEALKVRLPETDAFLGAGRFGKVFKVIISDSSSVSTRSSSGSKFIAMKVIKVRSKFSMNGIESADAVREFDTLKKMKDKKLSNVVTVKGKLVQIKQGDELIGYSYLMEEVCESIPLIKLSDPILRKIFQSLQSLHQAGCFHGDCRLQNILLSQDKKRIVFCDFRRSLVSSEDLMLHQAKDFAQLIISILATFGFSYSEEKLPHDIKDLVKQYEEAENKAQIIEQAITLLKEYETKRKRPSVPAESIERYDVKNFNSDLSRVKDMIKSIAKQSKKRIQLDEYLKNQQLKIQDCGGEGDCFFHVLAKLLSLSDSPYQDLSYNHKRLREIADEFLKNLLEREGEFLAQEIPDCFEQISNYLKLHDRQGVYADHFLISAIVNALGIHIRFINSRNPEESYEIGSESSVHPAGFMLYNVEAEHYQALVPIIPESTDEDIITEEDPRKKKARK